MSSFPTFLKPLPTKKSSSEGGVHSFFTHSERLGSDEAHCIWWPARTVKHPSKLILFIPGNPGLVDFYIPFLDRVYKALPDEAAILAHAHLGHSTAVRPSSLSKNLLWLQVESIIEVIDALKQEFTPCPKLILVGHSVGSWILLEACKERGECVTGSFLLFPTIRHIVRTPNGKRLAWLFHSPYPDIISRATLLARLLPRSFLSLIFRDWPQDQIDILLSFISSRSSTLSSLQMAHEEMETIKDLDLVNFRENKHKIWMFLAKTDDWVGDNRDALIAEMTDEAESLRVVHGEHGIPHAYCINHSEELAEQCLKWLESPELN